MGSFLRKRYLINPKFQLTFVAFTAGAGLVVSAVFYAAIRYTFSELHRLGVEAGLPEDDGIFTFLATHTQLVNEITIYTTLATVVLMTVLGIYLSHKVAGPMYRLHSHLTNIARGNEATPVQFREGDYFREIATAYNAHLKSIQESRSRSSKVA